MATDRSGANLATIAAAAGVSVPTVSKVINNRAGVSAGTRERIQQLIAEAGYHSPQGRRVRTSGRTMIDLVIGEVKHGYAIGVLNGILAYAHGSDIDVVVSSIEPAKFHLTDADDWADRMADSGRQGLLAVTSQLTPSQHAAFTARGLPVVVIDPLNTPPADLTSVGATNWAGGRAATEHLIGLGHRRIAYLGGHERAECNQARLHGYLAALMSAEIPSTADYIRSGSNFDRTTGLAGARAVLDLPEPPTAIFAASDTIAIGVLEEARARGIRVPEDLSIVGFDGTSVAEQSLPPLTSVAQPLQDIGAMALRTLLHLIDGQRPPSPRVELATELVVRGSTAPPQG
ncbi:LacI family DNA-binding transcriptional regulator [Microbacterium gorillae]|uniref:LacI family DNA-binding transcriptional regulator n=1 Tax=Microbacterium gorillae TaxID=1231063 RepID=UPI000AD1ACAD|nr:LacI family DNA-binding transcriptional regulator [Microbacterium gorillae]